LALNLISPKRIKISICCTFPHDWRTTFSQ
jgi:hypothetical protein